MTKRIVDVDTSKDAPQEMSEDEKTLHWIKTMFERAKKSRDEVFTRMDKNARFYEGNGGQWGDKKLPSYRAMIEDNRAFANVESALPIIIDNRPNAELVPRHPDDAIVVNELKDVYDAKWDELNLDLLTILSEKDALVLTEGWWKIWFDMSKSAIGDLNVTRVSPRNMYPDPDSTDPLLNDAYDVHYAARVTLSRLLLQYPEKADALRKEFSGKDSSKGTPTNRDTSFNGKEAYDTGDTPGTTTWSTAKVLGSTDKLMFHESWVDDQTAEEYAPEYIVYLDENGKKSAVEKTDAETQKAIESGKQYDVFGAKDLTKIGLEDGTQWLRKYPHGRIVSWVGDVLLRDDPSDYEHNHCPYVRFFRYTVPDKSYFFGEIDQIIPLQEELNKRKSQAVDLLNLTVNPPMLVYQGSGIDINKVTNRPGLVIPTNVPVDQAAKWLQMPNIPSAMFVQMSTINQDMDTVSGIHDVTQGRKPTGITAGVAIESLQEAAQTRLRLAAKFVEFSQKLAAEIMVSIIYQYYTEPRTIRKKAANGWTYKEVNFGSPDKKLQGGIPLVKIQSGSTMPMNKSVLRQQMVQLAQITLPDGKPLVDRRAVLETFDIPNIEGILARLGDGGNNASPPQTGKP